MSQRRSGVLLPVFSLPSPYGVGTFGAEARRFVDFLAQHGQTYWQMLPLTPTGYGDSPYQSFSAFAYNPYFIDLEQLVSDGLLEPADLESERSLPSDHVDYGWLYSTRYNILTRAYVNFVRQGLNYAKPFTDFVKEQEFWLHFYAAFMVIKSLNGSRSLQEWPAELRDSGSQAVSDLIRSHRNDMFGFFEFIQFEAYSQCTALKRYANEKGILLIGDAPIYMALDSADVWGHPESFMLNSDKTPVLVAGVPPDYFSATGQLWGNPIYDYKAMEKDGFSFWRQRIRAAKAQCDVLRIDHFRGLADYWAIPFGSPDARTGSWVIGPGEKLVDAINSEAGSMKIIAEDLGALDDTVLRLKQYSRWPGMKIMQFAFDSFDPESHDNPHNYEENCVAYLGTHDNETTMGFVDTHSNLWSFIGQNLGIQGEVNRNSVFDAMAEALTKSAANTVIYTMQDALRLGDEARLNAPSTTGKNWQFRLPADYDKRGTGEWLESLAVKGGRK